MHILFYTFCYCSDLGPVNLNWFADLCKQKDQEKQGKCLASTGTTNVKVCADAERLGFTSKLLSPEVPEKTKESYRSASDNAFEGVY